MTYSWQTAEARVLNWILQYYSLSGWGLTYLDVNNCQSLGSVTGFPVSHQRNGKWNGTFGYGRGEKRLAPTTFFEFFSNWVQVPSYTFFLGSVWHLKKGYRLHAPSRSILVWNGKLKEHSVHQSFQSSYRVRNVSLMYELHYQGFRQKIWVFFAMGILGPAIVRVK